MPIRYVTTATNATDRANKVPILANNPLVAGIVWQRDTNILYIYDADSATWLTLATGSTAVVGVAAGYKVARGEHQQATASDTVVTGLTTVVAVAIAPRTRTIKQLFFDASIGDQAGTPAAGSILITSEKPTAVNDVTPIAATDFTDNIKVNWIAVGT